MGKGVEKDRGEFSDQNQFHVDLKDQEEIYKQIRIHRDTAFEFMCNLFLGEESFTPLTQKGRLAQISQKHQIGDFELGEMRFKSGLFSKISTHLHYSFIKQNFRTWCDAFYQNPLGNGYWTQEKVEELQLILAGKYNPRLIQHFVNESYENAKHHTLIIKEPFKQSQTLVTLGYENDHQQQLARQKALKNQYGLEESVLPEDDTEHFLLQSLRIMIPDRYPALHIAQHHIDADFTVNPFSEENPFPTQPEFILGTQEDFTQKMENFRGSLEIIINACAYAKGIQQSGNFTIHPDPNPDKIK